MADESPDPKVVALTRSDGTAEFTCTECGAHVWSFRGDSSKPPICAHCAYLPGWQDDPILARIFGDG